MKKITVSAICAAARIAVVFLLASSSSLSAAAAIDIDPGTYTGTWRIQGETGDMIGPAQVELSDTTYRVIIGTLGSFLIDVDANGFVVSNNPGAATGGANILTLNSTVIHIDPAQFRVQNFGLNTALWGVSRVVKDVVGAADVVLVRGVKYSVAVGSHGRFEITLDANGNPTVTNPVTASVNGNTITFNTVQVSIDPAQYLNQEPGIGSPRWSVARVIKDATTAATVNLVPALRYGVGIGTYGLFFIQLDDTGVVSVENGFSAVGGNQSLTFNTTTIRIDPGDFLAQADGGATARWLLSRVLDFTQAPANAFVVPGVRYGIVVGSFGGFFFHVDQNGDISIDNGYSATAVGNTLVFNTDTVIVDPGSYTGLWKMGRVVENVAGIQEVNLVPGSRYLLAVGSLGDFFNVANPCAVDPSSIHLTNNSTFSATFSLSCGLLDGDDDGVPDANDNCPAIPNADQVDVDQDGAGDVCDDDLDGDGVLNGLDNCPDFANTDQADLDGDGLGDVCDGDVDGDSVVDGDDNCPLISNSDQGDNDADGTGDACDIDDDNDLIGDEADNCPFVANPNQSDFDGNGFGDACDDDVDGDGVLNDADDCSATPAGQPITPNGCSGSQYVDLKCRRDSFVQHGQYVSCVAHTAKDLADLGLISSKEKSIFVKQAAKKN